jgi:hypothetical protein
MTIVKITVYCTLYLSGHQTVHQEKMRKLGIVELKRDGPCAETRFSLSEKRTSPFESAGVSS